MELIEKVLTEQNKTEDLDSLKETDPIGYAVKVAEQAQREKQLAAVNAERTRLAQQQQSEQQQRLQQVIADEAQKLAQAIPDWQTEKGEDIRKDIRTYAKGLGFSDQELSQVYDSRAVLTLWKASQYDKLVAGKPEVTKKVAEAPKMMKPGTAKVSNPDSDALKAQTNKLRKTGRVRDAAPIFERFLR